MHKKSKKLSDKDKEILEFYQRAKKQYDDFFKRNGYRNFTIPKKEEETIYPSPSFEDPLTDHTIKMNKKARHQSPPIKNSLPPHILKTEDK